MEAGREVDVLMAEVMGWTGIRGAFDDAFWPVGTPPENQGVGAVGGVLHIQESVPYYSTDMAVAWPVHKMACGWIFSKRRTYLKELEGAILDRIASEVNLGYWVSVAWPDLLMFLEPVDICLAVLRAKGVKV